MEKLGPSAVMEATMFSDIYKNQTVCITGHTGFKGSWLCEWLLALQAHVVGYALEPPTTPSLFSELQLSERLTADIRGDVRSLVDVQAMLAHYRPSVIFHLAAQPLVRRSFDEPQETFDTNVMGSVNILEAVRRENQDCVVIMITTDKVYENVNRVQAYREDDRLGGYDPYSSSKACAELAIASYQQSFFKTLDDTAKPAIAIASARGGNVIGGGDWAEDRIVPDCVQHLARQAKIPMRNRTATRPWQHVLELLSGYLHLGAEIYNALHLSPHRDVDRLQVLCSPFNFGPHLASNKTVVDLVQEILKHWPGEWEDVSQPDAKHEAAKLNLTIDKAHHLLNWQPLWNFEKTIQHTVEWYVQFYGPAKRDAEFIKNVTQGQIELYEKEASYRDSAVGF